MFRRFELSCTRCHSLDGRQSEQVGPDLGDVGARRDRRHILASIVDPNIEIAKGFGTAIVETLEEDGYSGVILVEDEEKLVLEINETGVPERISIPKKEIAHRRAGKSSMPGGLVEKISLMELRDLVEFLASLQGLDKFKIPLAVPANKDG